MRPLLDIRKKKQKKLWGTHRIIVENIGYRQVTLVSVFRAESGNEFVLGREILREGQELFFGPIEAEVKVSAH